MVYKVIICQFLADQINYFVLGGSHIYNNNYLLNVILEKFYCDYGYENWGGHCYHTMSKPIYSFEEADQACQVAGANLLVAEDNPEMKHIQGIRARVARFTI